MQKIDLKTRREFFKAAAALGGVALASGGYFMYHKLEDGFTRLWRLHPAFRIIEISPAEIVLFTHLGNGEKLQHSFQCVEADLLREVAKEN